nr:hypothetical protein 1 [Paracoccaceae bacterium]BDD46764.1 hypothetical protein 17 [Paracoccaceae bacterium]
MTELITQIVTEPANQVINNANDFYKPTRYEWFGAHGTERYTFPTTFRPDFGEGNAWDQDWVQNLSASDISNNYVTRQLAPWKIPKTRTDEQHGFYVQSPSTADALNINVRIDGGIGHWMPAAIYRNIGWYWKNETAVNSNWRVWSPGLVLRNWRTNEEKIYSIGWTEAAYVNTQGQVKVVTGQHKSDPVNALGPDWFIYGVIFSVRSKSTQSPQAPKARLVDLVLSWHNPMGIAGSYKLIIPKKMSWDDFRAMKQRGEYAAESGGPAASVKQYTTSVSVNDSTFCPLLNDYNSSSNRWTGNCAFVAMTTLDGINLVNYVGTYSNVEIKFLRTDNGVLLYNGSVEEISVKGGNVALLHVNKIVANDDAWPSNVDIRIEVTGLF